MTRRATTEEEIQRIVDAGPRIRHSHNSLHDDLGWTWDEYIRYMNASNPEMDTGETPADVLESFKLTNTSPSLVPVKVVVERDEVEQDLGTFSKGICIETRVLSRYEQEIVIIDVASSDRIFAIGGLDHGRIFVQAVKTEEAER